MIHQYLPFPDDPTKALFKSYYQEYVQRLKLGAARVVLIAEEDYVRFFAALLASVDHQKLTIIADPHWQTLEWKALFESIEPDLILSQNPALQALKVESPKDYSPWYGYILLPTGGSSGTLKLSIHKWESFLISSQASKAFLKQKQLSSLSVLPPWHISGLMPFVRAYCTGGQYTYRLPKELSEEGLISLSKATDSLGSEYFMSLVPTLLKRVLHSTKLCEWLRGFRGIFVGGGPLLEPILQSALEKSLPILPTYGSTETASMVSLHPLDTPLDLKKGYSGKLLPHTKLSPPLSSFTEEPSRLILECESAFYGYYPSIPQKVHIFQTQDLACVEGNKLYIQGRQDAVIITGAKKVDPLEVESALLQTKQIQDCIVFSEPSLEWGEALSVLYVPSSPESPLDSIKDTLKNLLAPYKIPKNWYPTTHLPFNNRGKVSPQALQSFIKNCSNDQSH